MASQILNSRSMELDFLQSDYTMENVEFFGEQKMKRQFRVASMLLPKVGLSLVFKFPLVHS